mmetsp:Transcript_11810/g.47647  ORF Transcript_11810/g.47647 Transcript_11810/m.47647 type:complete len:737 (-) Transcript_11810:124-2334(-)
MIRRLLATARSAYLPWRSESNWGTTVSRRSRPLAKRSRRSSAARCVLRRWSANTASVVSVSSRTPLTKMRVLGMPWSSSLAFKRSVSATERSVGAATTRNSQLLGSWRIASSAKARSWSSRSRSGGSSSSEALSSSCVIGSYGRRRSPSLDDDADPPSPTAERAEASAARTSGFDFNLLRAAMARSAKSSKVSGNASIRSVWPVGAVSRTTASRESSRTRSSTWSSATSSSTPGGGVSSASASCASPSEASSPESLRNTASLRSSRAFSAAASASISRPSKFGATAVRRPLGNSMPSASPKECAGSVDATQTRSPSSARAVAKEDATVDLPTPPFPPTTNSLGAGRPFFFLPDFVCRRLLSSSGGTASRRPATVAKYCNAPSPTSSAVSTNGTSVISAVFPESSCRSRSTHWRCVAASLRAWSTDKSRSTRFTTTERHGTGSASTRRSVSLTESVVGIATATNSVVCVSVSAARSVWTDARSSSSRAVASSRSSTTCAPLPPSAPPASCASFFIVALSAKTLSRKLSANLGRSSNRSAWPVGAVSTTTTSNSFWYLTTCAKDTSSSIPGGGSAARALSSSSPSDLAASAPNVPYRSPIASDVIVSTAAFHCDMARPASTSIAHTSCVKPSNRVGVGPIAVRASVSPKASSTECAGSVDTMSTFEPRSASARPTAHDVVVLPTPPFPPTNTSLTPWRSSSGTSETIAAAAWSSSFPGGDVVSVPSIVAARRREASGC